MRVRPLSARMNTRKRPGTFLSSVAFFLFFILHPSLLFGFPSHKLSRGPDIAASTSTRGVALAHCVLNATDAFQ